MLFLPILVANLLDVSAGVSEPVVQLSLSHARVEGEPLFLSLGRVWVEWMVLYPANEHGRVPPESLPHGE